MPAVELVFHKDRAHTVAAPAGCAGIPDVSGPGPEHYLEFSGTSTDSFDFGPGQKGDFRMSCNLVHQGTERTHGAFFRELVRGKYLPDLCHLPTYTRIFFNEVGGNPVIRKVQSCGYPCYAPANDQSPGEDIHFNILQGLSTVQTFQLPPEEIDCFFCGFGCVRMNPGTLFPEVCDFEHCPVQARFPDTFFKEESMFGRSA